MPIQHNRTQGFTLIEMIITVVILAVISAVGVPSFISFLRNTELRSASESTLQGLQLARAEAVRRNERVRFLVADNTAWTVSTDSGTDIQSKPAREGSQSVTLTFTPTSSRRITFNSFGRIAANLDGTASITQIDFDATGKTAARSITITAGGQIHLCDPNVTTAGDPRTC